MTSKMPFKAVLNVQIPLEQMKAIRKIAEKNKVTIAGLIRGWVDIQLAKAEGSK